MRRVDRVRRALSGRPVDRVPRGELVISDEVVGGFLKVEEVTVADRVAFAAALDLDAAVTPDLEEVEAWLDAGFFLFGLVDGPFSHALRTLGFEGLMLGLDRCTGLLEEGTYLARERARAFLEAGAHGIVVADDIAYSRGTYVNPRWLGEQLFPRLCRLTTSLLASEATLFHSDGDISAVIGDVVEAGFCGLVGLDCLSDPRGLQERYGLILWGGFDLDFLLRAEPQEISSAARALEADLGRGGRYIFGTDGGLMPGIGRERLLALYGKTV